MPYVPSRDRQLNARKSNPFWEALEPIFKDASPVAPLGLNHGTSIYDEYIRMRRNDHFRHIETLRARLPRSIRDCDLGATDVLLLDFLLSAGPTRILGLYGPRGAGKTTLLHFAQAVLATFMNPSPTWLVIVDCLQLTSYQGEHDLLVLLRDTLKERVSSAPTDFQRALQAFHESLSSDLTVSGLRAGCAAAARLLPDKTNRGLVIVFDNLDQLPGTVADDAVALARSAYVATRIGSIIAFRPSSVDGLVSRGGARAFFHEWLEVKAPRVDVWLDKIGGRVHRAAERRCAEIDGFPIVDGNSVTPAQMSEAFGRFVDLLTRPRTEGDSVDRILEAVAADDTRHFIRLVERILSHRSLPVAYLLGANTLSEFHPIVALMEGDKEIFSASRDIPNLLSLRGADGDTEYLVLHRVLAAVDDYRTIETVRLFRFLSVYGYEEEVVRHAIVTLHDSGLFDGRDKVTFSEQEVFPAELVLSESGHYYLHSLLRTFDYLSCAVLDVPAEHNSVREHGAEKFAGRFESLLDYIESVRRAEERQVNLLAARAPSSDVRSAAWILARGGLLTSALLFGVEEAVKRGQESVFAAVRERVQGIEKTLDLVRRWRDGAKTRLEEVAQKGRRAGVTSHAGGEWREEGTAISFATENVGGEGRRHAVMVDGTSGLAVASVRTEGSVTTVALERVANERLKGTSGILEGRADRRGETATVNVLDLDLDYGKLIGRGERLGILGLDREGDQVRVRLQRYNRFAEADVRDLGPWVDRTRVLNVATEVREWVQNQVLQGLPFEDELSAAGTKLSDVLLDQTGCEWLAAQYKSLDTIIIHAFEPEIPVEWMKLRARPGEDQALAPIGDQWRTIRWRADLIDGAIHVLTQPKSPAAPLRTVGLEAGEDKSWRIGLPGTLGELANLTENVGTVHWIGHRKVEGRQSGVQLGQQNVTADLARAIPFRGVRNVILTCCEAASVPKYENVAVAIAEMTGCVVWAPCVAVTREDAARIDDALAAWMNGCGQNRSLERFMKKQRNNVPQLRLYVRYGVARPAGTRSS